MAYEHQSGSIDGRFELQIEPWEARNTHWVLAPQIRDTINDRILFKPLARAWSFERAIWAGAQVSIHLRRYPGDQRHPYVKALVDCEYEVGRVEGGGLLPLSKLEAELDRFLSNPL